MSLAEEARIIRREEKRWPGTKRMRHSLREHRVVDVRREARAAQLAYGFLRGRRYRQLEAKCHLNNNPNWSRVTSLAAKYGRLDKRDAAQRLAEWSSEAA